MPLNIRNEDVNRLAETVAAVARISKTEAVRVALTDEPKRRHASLAAFRERIRPIQDAIAACPPTGLDTDKAFYDDLNREP